MVSSTLQLYSSTGRHAHQCARDGKVLEVAQLRDSISGRRQAAHNRQIWSSELGADNGCLVGTTAPPLLPSEVHHAGTVLWSMYCVTQPWRLFLRLRVVCVTANLLSKEIRIHKDLPIGLTSCSPSIHSSITVTDKHNNYLHLHPSQ